MSNKLIETASVERDYGFRGTQVIIDSEKHGRLFIEDGFGGMDSLAGGQVRWNHGMAVKVSPNATIESLTSLEITESGFVFRPIENLDPLPWNGFIIASIAASVGL